MRRLVVSLATLVAIAGVASAQTTIFAQPTANNGGSAGWAMFLDLEALGGPISVTHLQTASTAVAGGEFSIEVFTRPGSALGGPVNSGPGSSSTGWTSIGIANAVQGAVASGISEQIDIPDIHVPGGSVVGVALQFTGVGPRYFGTGSPPYSVYEDSALRLTTGDGRSNPFTGSGSFFASRALTGSITYVPEPAGIALLSVLGLALAFLRR